MNPEGDWVRVRSLFEEALEQPVRVRESWVREACSGDSQVYGEVLSLLEAEARSGAFLDEPYFQLREPEGAADSGPFPECPRYRLAELLGRGGMGSVYRGFRDDAEYQQEVCVKILRRDLMGEEWVGRFRKERQILANLSHPNIARLLDGGSTRNGRPFLVMEHVDGLPIDRFCEERGLGIRERVRLLARVCRAVHVAHQNLIVHRDLKPGNILVQPDGQPKLLDFGIAKLLDPDRFGAEAIQTRTGAAMTPEYASPEQVLHRPITTASDVYSLGIIAYELLTGRKPYRVDYRIPIEVTNAISGQDPMRPSAAVRSLGHTGSAEPAPEAAGPVSAKRVRQLRGDLDTITLKALRKDPQRRFSSAQGMAEDLDRYLQGRPVSARPDTLAYRLGKLIGRNKLGAVTAVAVTLLMLLSATTFLGQHRRILKENRRAEETARFLVELFAISDPDRSQGHRVTAREVMNVGAAEIDVRLQDDPELRAHLKETVGRVYLSLGLYQEAGAMVRESLELRSELFGSESLEVVPNLIQLGLLEVHMGKWPPAADLYRRAQTILAESGRRGSVEMAETLHGLAAIARARDDLVEAERLHRESISIAEALPPQDREQLANSLRGLGVLMRIRGDLDEAEVVSERSLDIYRSLHGDHHPEVAGMINNLALIDVDRGSFPRAEERFQEALSIQQQIYEENHPSLATVQDNLASLLYDRGRYQEGEALCRDALRIRRHTYPEGHPKVVQSLNLLGLLLKEQGQLDDAEPLLRDALAHWKRLYGDRHPSVAAGMLNIGDLLYERKDYGAAAPFNEQALEIYQSIGAGDHPRLGQALNRLGRLRKAQGNYEAAESHYREALQLLRRRLGDRNADVATALNNLGLLMRAKGDAIASLPHFREALSVFQEIAGEKHRHTALVEKNLASALVASGRYAEAESLARRSLATFDEQLRETHPWRRAAQSVLGRSLMFQQKYAEAEPLLVQVFEARLKAGGRASAKAQSSLDRVVKLYELWGRPEMAARYRGKSSKLHSP